MSATQVHTRPLPLAPIIQEAVAIIEAVLDGDLDEARFRTCLITTLSLCRDLPDVGHAAGELFGLLGPPGSTPDRRFVAAIRTLSEAIDRAMDVGTQADWMYDSGPK
ncbi:hypothetical protein FIV34_11835 [Luteibacter pinisoli]|uniref:Uncharacterized protein n=1 Tax=Luteibacter pinisoli TaxID=2589080 RepID=A0A4Y5Z3I8_9GAMM|nr:hypothetical protein [Luteibacter pinisoli]QDE39851.1 hypothetical protein FIV34_11835 [Luteibacter pinisoli]